MTELWHFQNTLTGTVPLTHVGTALDIAPKTWSCNMVAQELGDVRGLISLLSPTDACVRLVPCTACSLGRSPAPAPCSLSISLRETLAPRCALPKSMIEFTTLY